MDNGAPRELRFRRYVGFETDLREFAVLLPAGRRSLAGCVNVRKSLVLADDLLRHWRRVPGRRPGRIAEAARCQGY